eukprot:365399-Chlamydomonas_euryale.AAC.13
MAEPQAGVERAVGCRVQVRGRVGTIHMHPYVRASGHHTHASVCEGEWAPHTCMRGHIRASGRHARTCTGT